MTPSHAIAIWLFELLDLDVALTGDLLEERARGRSAIWYWTRVPTAVWISRVPDFLLALVRGRQSLLDQAGFCGFD